MVQIFHLSVELRVCLLHFFCSVLRVAPAPTTPAHFKSIRVSADKPFLILCIFMALMTATCDFDLHPYTKGSCPQELQRVEQIGYTVRLIQDECGGALTGTAAAVEQWMRLLPGLYVVRSVDYIERLRDDSQLSKQMRFRCTFRRGMACLRVLIGHLR